MPVVVVVAVGNRVAAESAVAESVAVEPVAVE